MVLTKQVINQKGQVILAVLFIMTLALSVGVTMSNRFVRSLRNISQVDDLDKATSIAEAAIEKILLIPAETLQDYAENNSCGSTCHLEVTDINGQRIYADVALVLTGESFTEGYPIILSTNQTVEVFLQGYQSGQRVYVCWNNSASIVGNYIYTQSGTTRADSYAVNPVVTSHADNGFSTASSMLGYTNCMTVTASNTPLALRLKSYYADVEAYVVPAAGYALPVQGIAIEAVGHANSAIKSITVLKTNSYTPSAFDYVLFQKSPTESLSN